MLDDLRLGARVAAQDVMTYVSQELATGSSGQIDGHQLRDFLLEYWMNAGGLEDDDGEG